VIAVIGNRNTGFDSRLQDSLSLRNRNLLPINGQRDRFHNLPIISTTCEAAPAPTPTVKIDAAWPRVTWLTASEGWRIACIEPGFDVLDRETIYA
jgi:hypothetical protein